MVRMMVESNSLHLVRAVVERTGEVEGSAWKCILFVSRAYWTELSLF